MWWGKYDKSTGYTTTAFRDENHYNYFIEEMKYNSKYKELSQLFKLVRVSISGETLELDPESPRLIDLVDYQKYILQAKNIIEQ